MLPTNHNNNVIQIATTCIYVGISYFILSMAWITRNDDLLAIHNYTYLILYLGFNLTWASTRPEPTVFHLINQI